MYLQANYPQQIPPPPSQGGFSQQAPPPPPNGAYSQQAPPHSPQTNHPHPPPPSSYQPPPPSQSGFLQQVPPPPPNGPYSQQVPPPPANGPYPQQAPPHPTQTSHQHPQPPTSYQPPPPSQSGFLQQAPPPSPNGPYSQQAPPHSPQTSHPHPPPPAGYQPPPPPGPPVSQPGYHHQQGPPQPQPGYYHQPGAHRPPEMRQTRPDPNAMPSVAQLVDDEINVYKNTDCQLKFHAPASLPPLVTTLESQILKMSLQDDGCARPCHMRSTIYQVPISKDILENSKLEFAVVIKPFDDGEVQQRFFVPLSPSQIIRCNRCKAYANPFSKNGSCCICNFSTQTIQELGQNPELHLGSYEFRVTPEYYRNGIAGFRRPHIIFAIEMTANSVHLVRHLSKNLGEIIKNHLPRDFMYSQSQTPLVGFITYNTKITFYDVMNGGHAYVISDIASATECSSNSQFLVDPAEHFDKIESFLHSLAELVQDPSELDQQTVLGPALEAALKACYHDNESFPEENGKKRSQTNPIVLPTGKVYVFHSSLPTYGDEYTPGRLSAKRNIDDMKRQLGTEGEHKLLGPEGKEYTQLATKCVTDYASGVELFVFPPHPRAYLNLGTIGELARLTGTGIINKYHVGSLENFNQDLKLSLKSTMGFDASMRVRTSTGISPVKYIGNYNQAAGSNIEMGAVNTSSNFIVQLKYDDKISENELVVIQFAMIYTSVCGERRVRIHNLALSTCQQLSDLYKSACCDTLVNVLTREAIEKMRAGTWSPKGAKEQLTSRISGILAAYRKHCTDSPTSSASQLVLPEGLKLLPAYLCGALKCDAIDGGPEMFPDDKVIAQLNLLGALPSQSQVTIYPRMYSIEACEANDEENTYGLTAVLTRCYILAITDPKGQCYILENGYYLFIYFPNSELGQSFLESVFGPRKDDPDISWDLHRDSTESKFLEELIERIVVERRRALKIGVVRQGKERIENVFKSFLYEEKKRPDGVAVGSKLDNASYVEILCYLHSEIRAKLSQ